MIFWFHFAILVLLSALLGYSTWLEKRRHLIFPLLGLLALFVFHCLFWGGRCTACDLSSITCLVELILFWTFSLWGIFEAFKKSGGIS